MDECDAICEIKNIELSCKKETISGDMVIEYLRRAEELQEYFYSKWNEEGDRLALEYWAIAANVVESLVSLKYNGCIPKTK